ncbi:hypothetical protein GGX14DRAFT_561870 [Mycena pura]|uniref:Uncharacterized protein n=1 Tax=Mycena pura TaxID=153505 RepID=A0AAD6YJP5_9AGAR|nr:hypothetical protein GGX14DRAFT_561870 [Mycena pura]
MAILWLYPVLRIPSSCLMQIVWEHRFDLPSGIETVPANRAKVSAVVNKQMTEARMFLSCPFFTRNVSLSQIGASVNYHPKSNTRPTLMTLFTFCAGIALMRHVYMKDNGKDFWDTLEDDIEKIHNSAVKAATATAITAAVEAGDAAATAKSVKPDTAVVASKLTKTFKSILQKDRKNHGDPTNKVNDMIDTLPDTVDPLQSMINDALQGKQSECAPASTPANSGNPESENNNTHDASPTQSWAVDSLS